MSALDVLIRLSATGGDDVQAALRGVSTASQALTDNIKNTGVSVADLRKQMTDTGETLQGAIRSLNLTGQAATDAANAFRKAANDERASIGELKSAVSEEASTVKAAKAQEVEATQAAAAAQAKAATDYRANLSAVRNAGVAISAVGVGGMMLEQKMIDASVAAYGVEKRLESILRVQGRLNAAPALEAKINQTTEEGHFAKPDEIRNATVLLASYSMQTEHIKTLLPDVARQARTMGLSLDEVANQFGKAYGSGNVGMLRRAGVALTATEIAGVKAAYGISQANGQMEFMKAVTAAVERNSVALGDSLSRTQTAANDMAREGNVAMKQMGVGAGEAQSEVYGVLVAILKVTNASPGLEHAAGYLGYFVSGGMTAVGALMSVGSQIALLSLSMSAAGVTAGSMWTTMTAGAVTAGAAIWAAMAPVLAVVAAIAAVAIVAAAAMYALDKVVHGSEDKALSDNIAAGEGKDDESLALLNKMRAKHGLPPISKAESGVSAGSDDGSDMTPDGLKSQLTNAMSLAKSPSAMPSATGAAGTSVATGGESDIEGLEDQVAEHKKGFDANSASNRLRLTRRAERHEKEGQRALAKADREKLKEQKAADRDAKKAQHEAAREQKLQSRDNLAITKAENQANTEDQIANLEEQLEKAHDGKNAAAVRSLTLQIETARASQKYDDEMAQAAQTQNGDLGVLQQVAKIHYQYGLRRAQRAADKAEHSAEKSGGGGLSLAETLSALRGGASLNDLSGGRGGGTSSTQGGGGTREVSVPLQTTQERTPTGQLLIKVFGSVTVQDSFAGAMGGF